MSSTAGINPVGFVTAVKPLLEANDMEGLLELLKRQWSPDQIVSLLKEDCCDVRKVASLALSLVGGKCCISPLVGQLKDADPVVNQMAEHALWSIWFRASDDEGAVHQLARGSQALERREFEQAIEHFDQAIGFDPDFAEAYNQRAVVHYMREEFSDSVKDCERAVRLMPGHFGAWAGLGHSHTQLGELKPAREAYERALAINPHLECIAEMIEELKRRGG